MLRAPVCRICFDYFDPASAVSMDLDFGAAKIIEKITIEWEHAPLVSLIVCQCLPSLSNLAIAGIRNSKLCWWRMGHDLCDIHKQFGTDKILGPACESSQPANQDDESEHA